VTAILLIEDDAALARGLADNLRYEGHLVEHASDGETAIDRLESSASRFDLVLLDLMLPGMSGFEWLRRTANHLRRPPVVVISARDAEVDIVRALDLGAVDYLKKPFGLAELLARVRARLRERSSGSEAPELRFADVRVEFARFRLWKGRREHLLAHLEVEMLKLFASRPDQPIRRAEILAAAWGDDAYPTERTVDNFVVNLRRKIEDDPKHPRHLVTVHGYGYRFAPSP
jgi:DNA-binding response OmpR family regulator